MGHYCVVLKAEKCVRFLLEGKWVPLEYFRVPDEYNTTALEYAQQLGLTEISKMLQ